MPQMTTAGVHKPELWLPEEPRDEGRRRHVCCSQSRAEETHWQGRSPASSSCAGAQSGRGDHRLQKLADGRNAEMLRPTTFASAVICRLTEAARRVGPQSAVCLTSPA